MDRNNSADNEIVGREIEKYQLEKLRHSNEPELLAIYGRRRVGKTFLIHNYFKKEKLYFEVTGQRDTSAPEQLKNFVDAFAKNFLPGHELATPQSWSNALRLLANEIERLRPRGKVVLFFDELPWLASRKSGFLQALDHFWNTWCAKRKNIIVVLCGSAASWMIQKILYDKGGLHNRVTATIRLLPFTLTETEQYLLRRNIHLDRKQILELYMCIGGVPHYLKHIEPGQSAAQNIDRICFTKDGFLAHEFEKLYASLFNQPTKHETVVKALAKKRQGLTRGELLKATGLGSGGGSTAVLNALEESGFISRSVPFGKGTNDALYRLVDEYSLFYLTWIRTAPGNIFGNQPTGYWLQKSNGRSWASWAGFTFEGTCIKHASKIKEGLGISGIATTEMSWHSKSSNRNEQGAQIDLLIDRADNCISLCEMKYSDSEFVIDKSYALSLQNKREHFKKITRTKKTIFMTMVTTHGTKENSHFERLIDIQLTMDTLF